MTHLMQVTTMMQQPGAVRRAVAVVLRAMSRAMDAVAARLEFMRAAEEKQHAVVEFGTFEMDGRVVGAYYVDGELVTVVPDISRF